MALKTLNRRNTKDLKWPKIIIAILSTIGIVDTGSITLKNWGLFTSLSCPGIQNGCETVLNSPWGTLFENNQVNIPLSLAGFIIALPLVSLIAILFSYYEHNDTEKTIMFTKSIFIAVPASYLFFLPFFFAKSLNMNFAIIYASGLLLLVVGYFIHKYIVNFI